jgi:ribosome-binding factor A
MLKYKRSTRVAELIQQEISRIVQEFKEPGLGFVTITGVKLTEDLQSARIYYSIIGSEEDIKRSSDILKHSIPVIRHELAQRLNMRRTPTLAFEFDTTPERANRIFSILEKIKQEEETEKKKKP